MNYMPIIGLSPQSPTPLEIIYTLLFLIQAKVVRVLLLLLTSQSLR